MFEALAICLVIFGYSISRGELSLGTPEWASIVVQSIRNFDCSATLSIGSDITWLYDVMLQALNSAVIITNEVSIIVLIPTLTAYSQIKLLIILV